MTRWAKYSPGCRWQSVTTPSFQLFQGRPLVWNLAGGYRRDVNGIEPVLKLHRTTAQIQNIYQP